jgi:predicted dehydrogenase
MPHSLHHPCALTALAAGKHVFCEKPLATTLDDAREMWERAKKMGVRTGIQFGHRFSPALNRLRTLLLEGYVGQIQRLSCSWCFDWARDPSFPLVWRFQQDLAGAGALADLGVYAIDAARWLIGEFQSVAGSLRTYVRERPIPTARCHFDEMVRMFSEGALQAGCEMGLVENEDDCVFTASFENGAQGAFWASRMREEQRLSVYGSHGVLTWHLSGDKLYGKRNGGAKLEPISLPRSAAAPPFVSHFVASVRDDVERSPSFYDGLKAQEVIEAVLRSAEQQRWMSLAEIDHAATS